MLKQTCSFQLQVCLSMCDLAMNTYFSNLHFGRFLVELKENFLRLPQAKFHSAIFQNRSKT